MEQHFFMTLLFVLSLPKIISLYCLNNIILLFLLFVLFLNKKKYIFAL